MSSDPEQEYFSDGISGELLNLLSRIPKLRVIPRSSAFSFKGKDIDIPTIAEQLNVAYVLEGSVRKAGNLVRITTQLIEARSDTRLWSETYERQLENIFVIQDEISAGNWKK
jgi:TolB-like protein